MARSRQAEIRRAIGRIQRLCCLGVGGQALMPALMETLNEIVPASNRHFYWADVRLEIDNCYLEGPSADLLPLYLAEFTGGKREREVRLTFPEMMRKRYPTPAGDVFQRFFTVDWNTFVRSDYYNILRRPCGMEHGVLLKVTDGTQGLGAFHLFRGTRETTFTAREFAVLDALHRFIAHGLHNGPARDAFVDTDDRALVVADPRGTLLHISAQARRLLLMALLPRWAPDTSRHAWLKRPPEIVRLCQTLAAAFAGGLPTEPPVMRLRNSWGEFVLRAYWVGGSDTMEPSSLVGITMERREPRSLALLRKIEALTLTEREKQLCLLLARGNDTSNSARAMGVSEQTVVAHRRNLYHKLGVPNRLGLMDRLHAD